MYDLHHELIETLSSTPETLAGLLLGVTDAQARAAVDKDENWSIIEILCHLRDSDEIAIQRMTAMRDQDNPAIIGFDQEALVSERKYADADLNATLVDFVRFRAAYLDALTALTPEQWERTGQHNEIGEISIVSHCIHKTYHDAIHCAQIARQLIQTHE
jgi:hypothetical protein